MQDAGSHGAIKSEEVRVTLVEFTTLHFVALHLHSLKLVPQLHSKFLKRIRRFDPIIISFGFSFIFLFRSAFPPHLLFLLSFSIFLALILESFKVSLSSIHS